MRVLTHAGARFYAWSFSFANGQLGLLFLIIWAFLEANFWFIAPDMLLFPLCVLIRQRMSVNKAIVYAIIASFAGGLAYYLLHFTPLPLERILLATPFVSEEIFVRVTHFFSTYGVWGALFQSFTFIQFKIWTHLAFVQNINPVAYFAIVILSRLLRFGLIGYIGYYVGRRFENLIEKRYAWLLSAYVLVFIAMLIIIE